MKKIKVDKDLKVVLILLAGLVAFVAAWIVIDMTTKAKLWDALISTKEGLNCIKTMRHANPSMYNELQRCYENVQTLRHMIELS